MLVKILQTFDTGNRRWFAGENPDVSIDLARKWIADGYAVADSDGLQGFPLTADQSASGPSLSSDAAAAVGYGNVGSNHGLQFWPCCKVEQVHAVDGTSGTTFHQVFHIPVLADAWRPIYANAGASAYTVADAGLRPVIDSTTEAGILVEGTNNFNDAVVPNGLTFGGSATGVVPAKPAGTKRASYLRADWIERSGAARTDGFSGGLVAIRTYIAAGAGNITITGEASVNLTNWATNPSGERFIARQKTGDFVSTGTGFTGGTGATPISYGPVIGIEYMARGRVFTIFGFGDSTFDGAGVTYFGNGWGRRLAADLSAELGINVVWANGGWSGNSTAGYRDRLLAYAALGIKPDLFIIQAGSINDVSSVVDVSVTNGWRTAFLRSLAGAFDLGSPALAAEVQPVNKTTSVPPGSKNMDATDSLRVAYNAEVNSMMPGRVLPFGSVMAGAVESGQVTIKAGFTTDGVHENDAGAQLKADAARPFVRQIIAQRK